jgi:4-amino-4-deoxy-L-arabinose transferase-like glycosyltransferase
MKIFWEFLKKNKLFFFVLGVALFVRLIFIENVIFDFDEEAFFRTAKGIGLDNFLSVPGPRVSSTFILLGPFLFYSYAIILYLFKNIISLYLFNIVLNVASIAFLYLFLKKFFSYKSALLASLFYAFSPIIIIYSRRFTNPTPAPLFTILLLWLLYEIIFYPKNKKIFFLPIIFSLAFHIHFSLVNLIFASLVTLVIFRSKINKKYLILGFLTAVLLNSFFLHALFEKKEGSEKIQNFSSLIAKDNIKLENHLSYVGKMLIFRMSNTYTAMSTSLKPWNYSLYFIPIIFFFSCFSLIFKRNRKTRILIVFSITSFLPFLFLANSGARFYWFFFPLIYIFIGIFLADFLGNENHYSFSKKISTIFIIVFLTGNLFFILFFLRLTNILGYIPEDHGNLLTLKTKREISEAYTSLGMQNNKNGSPDNLFGFSSRPIFMNEGNPSSNIFLNEDTSYIKNNYSEEHYMFFLKKDFCIESIVNKKTKLDVGKNIVLISLDSSLDYSSLASFNENDKTWNKIRLPMGLSKEQETTIKINYLNKKNGINNNEKWIIIPKRTFHPQSIKIDSFRIDGREIKAKESQKFQEYYIFEITDYVKEGVNELKIESKPSFMWGYFSIFDLQISKDYCFYDNLSS